MNNILTQLADVLEQRKSQSPDASYVATLYHKGLDSILKKIGEEISKSGTPFESKNKPKGAQKIIDQEVKWLTEGFLGFDLKNKKNR